MAPHSGPLASPGLPQQHGPGVGPSSSTSSAPALPVYHLVDSPTDLFDPNPTRVLCLLGERDLRATNRGLSTPETFRSAR